MKIAIYAPGLVEIFGGGEKYISKIAEILSEENSVDFIVTKEPNMKELENRLNVNLSRVAIKHIKIPNLLSKVRYLKSLSIKYAISRVTRKYDLFINQDRFSSIPSLARRGILLCEIPPTELNQSCSQFKSRFKNLFLDPRSKTYNKVIANSLYTKKWAEKYYSTKIEVLYPPVDTEEFLPSSKQNIILSIGRFFVGGHCKKQLEMIRVFKDLYMNGESLKSWAYHLVGGINNDVNNQNYLRRCKDEAQGYPIYFHINAPFQILQELCGKAKIYWHATGLYENEDMYPERMEHFGISTVEAMSAGCVPVVINRGGQPEIVRHNTDGFLWDTLEELKKYTLELVNNRIMWKQMSESSIKRSQEFNIKRFREAVKRIFACREDILQYGH
jgi:glycosyltransferase involved in cell wall biosynthesis